MPRGIFSHKKGYHLSENHKQNISISHKKNGIKPPVGSHKGHKHSEESRKLISLRSNRGRLKNCINCSKKLKSYRAIRCKKCSNFFKREIGEKCRFWKGGVTKINIKIRSSFEMRLWRKTVFERDRWTCVWCGYRRKKKSDIHADHIKPFAYYPELRFAIDNGRTLCVDCHKKTASYPNNFK